MKLQSLCWLLIAMTLSACATREAVPPDSPRPDWQTADIPSLQGRIYVVTGGTSGIGFETAKALAAAGARVVIAARDPVEHGEEIITRIRVVAPGAPVEYKRFDLSNLATVRALAAELRAGLPRIDGLINNAGIMEPPERRLSAEGFESQFAINYLGHFVLTAELLPLLLESDAPRVIMQSSIAANRGTLHFEDLQFAADYDAVAAYRQSKLACLMFALELQRRSDAAGWGLQSIATHPGLSRTNLNESRLPRRILPFLFQSAAQGAIPALYAATSPDARGGSYYGPTGLMSARGDLGFAVLPDAARSTPDAARLWRISEELTGTRFPHPGQTDPDTVTPFANTGELR